MLLEDRKLWQYIKQPKEMPWNTDWSKPFYEIIYPPGKGRFPDEFAPVEEEYIQKWDEDVKAGKKVTIEFPDFSDLYLDAALTKQDQEYLSNLFWQQCWYRYWSKIAPWLGTDAVQGLLAVTASNRHSGPLVARNAR